LLTNGGDIVIRFRLKEILETKHMTINELSNLTGISRPTLYGMYKNDSQMVQLKTLEKVSETLQVSVSKILVDDRSIRNLSMKLIVSGKNLDATVNFICEFLGSITIVTAKLSTELVSEKYWVVKLANTYSKDWNSSEFVYTVNHMSDRLRAELVHTLFQKYMKEIEDTLIAKRGINFYVPLEYVFFIDNCFSGRLTDCFYNDMNNYELPSPEDLRTHSDSRMFWPQFEGKAFESWLQSNDFDEHVVTNY
jgi:DNA-binding Xre family transcriptional regulator